MRTRKSNRVLMFPLAFCYMISVEFTPTEPRRSLAHAQKFDTESIKLSGDNKMRPQPACPECEKLSAVSEESNKIGNFLSWLSQQQVALAEWDEDSLVNHNYRLHDSGINQMLADYFDIDLNKVDKERMELLKWVQEQYNEKNN